MVANEGQDEIQADADGELVQHWNDTKQATWPTEFDVQDQGGPEPGWGLNAYPQRRASRECRRPRLASLAH